MDALDVKILGCGGNWVNLGGLIALGLNGYYSPLPKGSTVSITTGDPGPTCLAAPRLIGEGKFHMGISTPNWYGRLAYEGKDPFDKPLPIRTLAVFPHDDRLAFAVRRETGLRRISDIREKKYPLKFSTPSREMHHPAGWVTEAILNEYDITYEDIESWGGKLLQDRPRNQNHPDAKPVSDEFDAVFDEALMTRRWNKLTEQNDLVFLPVDDAVIDTMVGRGMVRGAIDRGRFRGVEEDVPTIDFSGWLLMCHADIPDELAYLTIGAIEQQKEAIEDRFPPPFSGMTGKLDFSRMAGDALIPLHPGAEKYYREKGYL